MYNIRPLHPEFGAIVEGCDLARIDAAGFAALRALFEEHSALLLKGQALDDRAHTRLAEMFGPLENRAAMAGEEAAFKVAAVSNVTAEGGVTGEFDMHTLNLKSNMLWHTDSTFLPVPALVNVLMAQVVPSQGGETELASTRAAFAAMDATMQDRLRDAIIWHRYAHSRAKISPELAGQAMFNHWPDRPWRAVWKNPVTGAEAVYIASHAFAVEGLTPPAASAFIDELVAFCTQERFVYSHAWEVGDVLIFDERATMHRGRPWDYTQARTLKSICSSVTEADGLDTVRTLRIA